MKLFQAYMHLLIFLSLTAASSTASPMYTKEGCNYTCGNNVKIPYPFGIGADCSINDWYTIDCQNSTPYLSLPSKLEVLGIILNDQTVTVNTSSVSYCKTPELKSRQTQSIDIGIDSPFYFSWSTNSFVFEGCGNASITSNGSPLTTEPCSNPCLNIRNNGCFGGSCHCQENTSRPVKSYSINQTGSGEGGGCGFGLVVDKESHALGKYSLTSVPISLTWTLTSIDIQECCGIVPRLREPKNRTSYEQDDISVESLGCYRAVAYTGNPYIPNGCECSSKRCAGSKKRGSGTKKNSARPKVRANLGEPTRFRLQDEPDQNPQFQTQQYPIFQTQQFPHFQSPPYQNPPFVPPYQPQQFLSQPFQQFQPQSHQVDPLEDETLIHRFASQYREPQPSFDDDEDEDDIQEEEEDAEEEEDDVQEVVPPAGRRSWTSEEEVALVKAYLHISENKKISNEQKKDMFWRRVIAHFNKLPGSTERNMDQMTSKWGDLNRKISKFNGCFIQVTRIQQSGSSENTIMQAAIAEYCTTYKKRTFPHTAAWEVARNHPKWVPVDLVDLAGPTAPKKRGPKRSKNSDSGNYTTSASENFPKMNLNIDLEEPNQPDDEPAQEDTPTRPRQRKSGESSSKGKESVAESISNIEAAKLEEIAKREKLMSAKLEREHAYMGHLKAVERQNDLKILCEPHTHLDEPFKSIVIQQKREICERWG